ncbi:hypothetical protein PV10_06719 [Exophiala mesophila]|uniref:Uncharacterized protein n=1 Tax=Exophiala mesophila TaxID=212818 RepID=A0A0D1ZC27_EXOME|nr:uncharacterized protein PV10_06719 [Exophiala mesophila]KIV92262.1 hypothetical protein PV10_06719 [Exophiala mesophila]
MQGFNMGRYVPPDLEGVVSANRASGKGHALGSRASKLATEGILIVRFECPFAIWCTNCHPEQIIGQGVRFNAEKRKVGNYLSTPIWSFRFKHTVCGGWIEVRTDPKNAEYLVIEGGRRRDYGAERDWEDDQDGGEAEVRFGSRPGASEEEKQRMERDGGFGVMENKVKDKTVADGRKRRIEELMVASDKNWADPYAMSKKLRADFRIGRRQRQQDQRTGDALQDKFGLEVEMLAELPEDHERVKYIDFGQKDESSSSTRPMFVPVRESLPSRAKKASKHDHKDHLQTTLRTNTRIATDPFLREGIPWKPRVKRKREEPEADLSEALRENDHEHKRQAGNQDKRNTLSLVGYDSDSS